MTRKTKVTLPAEVIQRIQNKTEYDGDCWRFTGKKTGKGYGNIWYNGKTIRIGRLICHLYHGMDLFDRTLVACHSDNCRFVDCWNPKHLRPDTQKNNVADQIRKGTFHYGSDNIRNYSRGKLVQQS